MGCSLSCVSFVVVGLCLFGVICRCGGSGVLLMCIGGGGFAEVGGWWSGCVVWLCVWVLMCCLCVCGYVFCRVFRVGGCECVWLGVLVVRVCVGLF